jgi:hypothetical protein
MNLSPKYILVFFLFIVSFFGYNAWLIQRDNKLFDAYKNRQQQYCEQLKEFHPDCKIE